MKSEPPPEEWSRALTRAGHIAAADQPLVLCSDRNWDFVGIRAIIAVVLHALADRTGCSPDDVPLLELLEHCERGARHVRELAVPLVGEQLAVSVAVDLPPGWAARAVAAAMSAA
ncbi:hypothetical protein ACFVT5_37960 [Streptomyces sp. NPDC058001]|uniref:hypothetical protein n=1 Tax=Streptomyces sp. NPDC058001 TaxID=3346300 RepID=UPI0036EA44B5